MALSGFQTGEFTGLSNRRCYVLIILLLAVFGTFLLMLPAAFLLNLAFWNDTDKKCAFALCFFISQSVLYWVWLCEEREEPPGVK